MKIFVLGPLYLSWHYTRGILDMFGIFRNITWFLWRFFSIKELLKTFFSPFKRLKEKYQGGLDLGNLLESIIVTTIMRLVGMLLRLIIIVIGLATIIISLLLMFMILIIWIVLPAVILFVFIVALISLLK